MEKYKDTVRKRIIFFGFYSVLVLLLVLFGLIFADNFAWLNKNMAAFDAGVSVGLELVMLFYVGKYIAAIKNEEKLKKLYIEETDERSQYISTKVGGTSTVIIILSLFFLGLVAGYFNLTVFVSLIGAAIFSSLVVVIIRLYYNSKY